MLEPDRPHADFPSVTAPDGCETGQDGLECREWVGWWWVILVGLQLMRGDNIKIAPYASSAGHIHGLGQAFWMALHTLGILHELPGLSERRKTGNWSAPYLQSLLPNAVWVHLSERSGDTNHLLERQNNFM